MVEFAKEYLLVLEQPLEFV